MSAQIIPFGGVRRVRDEAGATLSHRAILFARGLAQVEREIAAKIEAGRTAEAIFASGDLVALTRFAASISPACVERALCAAERIKAAIDASVGGRESEIARRAAPPTFDNQDDPA